MPTKKRMTVDEKKKVFQEELEAIMAKYEIDIYPANVVMPSGEVMPMIKMASTAKEEVIETKDGDTTKK